MDKRENIFRISNNNVPPQKGSILIAEPFLDGRYFKRSVIFITEHSNTGSVGFVLNKPVGLSIGEVIDDLKGVDSPVFVGGPVDTNRIYFVHSLSNQIPGSISIGNGLFWGGDFDVLKKLLLNKTLDLSKIIFFAGYSGWEAGQLDDEIVDNSWLVGRISDSKLLNNDYRFLWKDSLHDLGGRFKLWSNFPQNPNLN